MQHSLPRGTAFAVALLLASSIGLAWSQSAGFSNTVHGHEFHRVSVESAGCVVKYRLGFTAPKERYAGADENAPRFRFVAQLKFKDGHVVRSPIFPNAASGERKYESSFDTKAETCWANAEQKLIAFDVRGCRGRGCTPEF
jgi:hypothetical protein